MKPDPLTNDNLMTTDFAQAEKKRALQSKRRPHRTKAVLLAPSIPAHGVWMTDVSAMDRRSVRAQLAGRGDFRVTWWKLNCLIHGWFKPRSSLEQRMYAFHARHHALTIARMELINDYWCIYKLVTQQGFIAGLRYAARKEQQATGEQP
jgi:hypothetical protein